MDAESMPGAVSYWRVVHRAGVRLRTSPSLDPTPDAMVLPEGSVLTGRRVGEYVLVQQKPVEASSSGEHASCVDGVSGGWLPIFARGQRGLEECRGPGSVEGSWWYRVVHPRGARFLSSPQLDATRHDTVWECGSMIRAVRKVSAAGSSVALVELEDGNGYVVEASPPFDAPSDDETRVLDRDLEVGGGEPLEKFDGCELVESVSPEERDVGEVYFRVVHQGGLLVRIAPSLDAQPLSKDTSQVDTGVDSNSSSSNNVDGGGVGGGRFWNRFVSTETPVVLSMGSTFRGTEVLRPAGSDATFVLLGDYDGWVCAVRGGLLAAAPVSAPLEDATPRWYQAISRDPLPVLLAPHPSPEALPTGRSMGLGMVFHCSQRMRPIGESRWYAQVHTPGAQGWVAESAPMTPVKSRSVAHFPSAERHLLRRVHAPTWIPGPWLVQVLYLGGLRARMNPHPLASAVAGDHAIVPPFAIVRVDGALFVRSMRRRKTTHNDKDCVRRGLFIDDPSPSRKQAPVTGASKSDSTASTTRDISGTKSGNDAPDDTASTSPGNIICWDNNGAPILPHMNEEEGFEDEDDVAYDDDNESLNSDCTDEEDLVGTNSSSDDEDYNDASRVSEDSNEGYGEAHEAGLFLKLSGRPGWLLTHSLDNSPAVARAAGTPTEERGRFVYKVLGISIVPTRKIPVATVGSSIVADSFVGSPAAETSMAKTGASNLVGDMALSDSQEHVTSELQKQRHPETSKPLQQQPLLQPLRVRHGPCHEAPLMTGATVSPGSLVTARVRLTQFLDPPTTLSSDTPQVDSMAHTFVGGEFPIAPSSHAGVATDASGWLPLWDLDSLGRRVHCLELVEEEVESCNEGKPLSSWLTPTPSDPEDVWRRKNAPDFALAGNEQVKNGGSSSGHGRSEGNRDDCGADGHTRAHQPSARGSPPIGSIADDHHSWRAEVDADGLDHPDLKDRHPPDTSEGAERGCSVH